MVRLFLQRERQCLTYITPYRRNVLGMVVPYKAVDSVKEAPNKLPDYIGHYRASLSSKVNRGGHG